MSFSVGTSKASVRRRKFLQAGACSELRHDPAELPVLTVEGGRESQVVGGLARESGLDIDSVDQHRGVGHRIDPQQLNSPVLQGEVVILLAFHGPRHAQDVDQVVGVINERAVGAACRHEIKDRRPCRDIDRMVYIPLRVYRHIRSCPVRLEEHVLWHDPQVQYLAEHADADGR